MKAMMYRAVPKSKRKAKCTRKPKCEPKSNPKAKVKAVPGMAAKPVEAKTCGHGDGGAPSGGMHDAVYVSCSSSSGVDSASDSDSRDGMVTVHAESGCGGGMIGSKRKVGTAATAHQECRLLPLTAMTRSPWA